MKAGLEIMPEHMDAAFALISASLVPVVMDSIVRHIQANGENPTEEDMDGFRQVALGEWIMLYTLVKSRLTVRAEPPSAGPDAGPA